MILDHIHSDGNFKPNAQPTEHYSVFVYENIFFVSYEYKWYQVRLSCLPYSYNAVYSIDSFYNRTWRLATTVNCSKEWIEEMIPTWEKFVEYRKNHKRRVELLKLKEQERKNSLLNKVL